MKINKLILVLLLFFSLKSYSQFENRTHLLAGANIKVSKKLQGYNLYRNYVLGAESILGFKFDMFFVGVGAGAEYTGNNVFEKIDSLTNEIKKINVYNVDIPMFLDVTFGKKLYVEAKVGYSYKLVNIKDYRQVNLNTLFNSIGLGYSIPVKDNLYIDLAVEGKFNHLFTGNIRSSNRSLYFLPIAKVGFRFTKASL